MRTPIRRLAHAQAQSAGTMRKERETRTPKNGGLGASTINKGGTKRGGAQTQKNELERELLKGAWVQNKNNKIQSGLAADHFSRRTIPAALARHGRHKVWHTVVSVVMCPLCWCRCWRCLKLIRSSGQMQHCSLVYANGVTMLIRRRRLHVGATIEIKRRLVAPLGTRRPSRRAVAQQTLSPAVPPPRKRTRATTSTTVTMRQPVAAAPRHRRQRQTAVAPIRASSPRALETRLAAAR